MSFQDFEPKFVFLPLPPHSHYQLEAGDFDYQLLLTNVETLLVVVKVQVLRLSLLFFTIHGLAPNLLEAAWPLSSSSSPKPPSPCPSVTPVSFHALINQREFHHHFYPLRQ